MLKPFQVQCHTTSLDIWNLIKPLLFQSIPLERVPITLASLKQSIPTREITLNQLYLEFRRTTSNPEEEDMVVDQESAFEEDWFKYQPYLENDPPILEMFIFSSNSIESFRSTVRNELREWLDAKAEASDQSTKLMIIALCPNEYAPNTRPTESHSAKLLRKAYDKYKPEIDLLLTATPNLKFQPKVLRLIAPKLECDVALAQSFRSLKKEDPNLLESWDKFIQNLTECVSAGVSARLAREITIKENLQSSHTLARYTQVFSAAEHISASLFRCGLIVEALSVYDSLDLRLQDDGGAGAKRYRTLFHSSGLPTMGSASSPTLFLNKDLVIGKLLLPDTITYVEFRQYLVKKQLQLLYALKKTDRMVQRLLSFLKSLSLEFVELCNLAGKESKEAASRVYVLQLCYNMVPFVLRLSERDRRDSDGKTSPSRLNDEIVLAVAQLYFMALENFWWLIQWREKDRWCPLSKADAASSPHMPGRSDETSPINGFLQDTLSPSDAIKIVSDKYSAQESELALFSKVRSFMNCHESKFQRTLVALNLLRNTMPVGYLKDARITTPMLVDETERFISSLSLAATECNSMVAISLLTFACRRKSADPSLLDKVVNALGSYLVLHQKIHQRYKLIPPELNAIQLYRSIPLLSGNIKLDIPASPGVSISVDVIDPAASQSVLSAVMNERKNLVAAGEQNLIYAYAQAFATEINPDNVIDVKKFVPSPFVTLKSSDEGAFSTYESLLRRTTIKHSVVMPKINNRGIHNFLPSSVDQSSRISLGSRVFIQVALKSDLIVPLYVRAVRLSFTVQTLNISHLPHMSNSSLIPIKRGLSVSAGSTQPPHLLIFRVDQPFTLEPGSMKVLRMPWVVTVLGKFWVTKVRLFLTDDDSGESPPRSRMPSEDQPLEGRNASTLIADLSLMETLTPTHILAHEYAAQGNSQRKRLYSFSAHHLEKMWRMPRLLDVCSSPSYFSIELKMLTNQALIGDTTMVVLNITSPPGFILEQPPKVPLSASVICKNTSALSRTSTPLPFKVTILWSQIKSLSVDGNDTYTSPNSVLPVETHGEMYLSLPKFQSSISILIPLALEQISPAEFDAPNRPRDNSPVSGDAGPRILDSEDIFSQEKYRLTASRKSNINGTLSAGTAIHRHDRRALVLVPGHAKSPVIAARQDRKARTSFDLGAGLSPRSIKEVEEAEIALFVKIRALVSIRHTDEESKDANSGPVPISFTNIPTDNLVGLPPQIVAAEFHSNDVHVSIESPLPGGGGKPTKLSNSIGAPERQIIVEESSKLVMQVKAGLEAARCTLLDRKTEYAEKLSLIWKGYGSQILINDIAIYPQRECLAYPIPLLCTHMPDSIEELCQERSRRIIKFPSPLMLSGSCPVDILLTLQYQSEISTFNRIGQYIMELNYQMVEDSNLPDTENEAVKSRVKFVKGKTNDLRLLLDLPLSPRPYTLNEVINPLSTLLGTITTVKAVLSNNTSEMMKLYYSIVLPCDQGSTEMDWQVIGFTTKCVEIEPMGSTTVQFGLIPLITGVLRLPALQLGSCMNLSEVDEVRDLCWTTVRICVESQSTTKCRMQLLGQAEEPSEGQANTVS